MSVNDEHSKNIYEKSLQFDTFHFSNDLISVNDEHLLNNVLKLLKFKTFYFSND